jgi:hypothetical protein
MPQRRRRKVARRKVPRPKKPRSRLRRRTAAERKFEKMAESVGSAKSLRFGRRVKKAGKYFQQVKDRRGRVIAEVPWSPKVKRTVRAAVEHYFGTASKRTRREAGLDLPGWNAERGAFNMGTREAVWTREVWRGRGVPVGTPMLPKNHKSFGWFGAAFRAVEPDSFSSVIDRLPKHMLQPGGASIGLVLTVRTGGRVIKHVYFKDRIDSYLSGSEKQFLTGLFQDALTDVAHEFGYAGEAEIIAVSLMVGGQTL